MFEVKILDAKKPILMLKWAGNIKKEEVIEATTLLDKCYREIGSRPYYLLVDVSELKVFSPDTKEAIIEQQKYVLPKIIRVASVMNLTITKMQLQKTRESAKNDKETVFDSFDKAFDFLKNLN